MRNKTQSRRAAAATAGRHRRKRNGCCEAAAGEQAGATAAQVNTKTIDAAGTRELLSAQSVSRVLPQRLNMLN